MKKTTLILAAFLLSFMGFAQNGSGSKKPISFNAGVELGLPLGDFSDIYSFGVGATVQANYQLNPKIDLTLNTGYLNYFGKTVDAGSVSVKYGNLGVIPVLAGARYWLTENIYGAAQLGISFWSINGTASASNASSENNFTWSPAIGYRVSKFDISLKYNSINASESSLNSLGLRAAYNF
jgi:hypothetical protein